MIFPIAVVLSGVIIVLAFNPTMTLLERARLQWARHREVENLQMRRLVSVARINHIYNAAMQAMWDESLHTERAKYQH